MLPKFLKVLPDQDGSIQIRHEKATYFNNPWHFHPELELTLILKSSGSRFVGDSIGVFGADDLVLLGANLPHYWRNDSSYYKKTTIGAEAVVVRFREKFLGDLQYELPEMKAAKVLFEKSRRGYLIQGDTMKQVKSLMLRMLHQNGLDRLITFLQIMNILATSDEKFFLSSEGFECAVNPRHERRMNEVYQFITANYRKKVSLQEIAERAHMNPSAFSRYFKQCAGKSVTAFIQELRLGHACKLLIQSEKNVGEIIYDSGFQSQAHFNKLFVDKMGHTPRSYRLSHRTF